MAASPEPEGGPTRAAAENMVAVEQAARPREEINALFMGFGVGLLIGFFFLVYVVISIWNPTF